MNTSATKPIPDGMHSATPHLMCAGAAEAIEFYKKAFNATETVRLPGPNGNIMHANIRIGDSAVMLVGHHARSGCDAGTNERSPADHEPRITGRRITRGPVSERLTLRIQALSWRHVSDLVQ